MAALQNRSVKPPCAVCIVHTLGMCSIGNMGSIGFISGLRARLEVRHHVSHNDHTKSMTLAVQFRAFLMFNI